jgi:hypothetical protein
MIRHESRERIHLRIASSHPSPLALLTHKPYEQPNRTTRNFAMPKNHPPITGNMGGSGLPACHSVSVEEYACDDSDAGVIPASIGRFCHLFIRLAGNG